jgi:hypothetical protein
MEGERMARYRLQDVDTEQLATALEKTRKVLKERGLAATERQIAAIACSALGMMSEWRCLDAAIDLSIWMELGVAPPRAA